MMTSQSPQHSTGTPSKARQTQEDLSIALLSSSKRIRCTDCCRTLKNLRTFRPLRASGALQDLSQSVLVSLKRTCVNSRTSACDKQSGSLFLN